MSMRKWFKKSSPGGDDNDERQSVRRTAYNEITINNAAANATCEHFHDNVISTTKYTRYNFVFVSKKRKKKKKSWFFLFFKRGSIRLPFQKNLFEQFRRVTNVYNCINSHSIYFS